MFENNQVFRISKRSSIRYPSLYPFVQCFEDHPQKDNQEMVELKSLLDSTTSLVDNLRKENSLIRSETQDIKETLMEYVKVVTDENKELRNEIKVMSIKMEKANQELLEKIEEKMRTLEKFEIKKRKQMNQSNYEVINQQNEKKIAKKNSFTVSQVFYYQKPSDQNQRSKINEPFNTDRKEEELDKNQPCVPTIFFPLEKRKSIDLSKIKENEINKSFDTFLEQQSLNLKTENKKQEEKNELFCNILELQPLASSPFSNASLSEEIFNLFPKRRDLSYDKFDKLKKTDENEEWVYGTNFGSCYHRSTCYHLHRSKVPTPLSEAKMKWRPCSICRPTP